MKFINKFTFVLCVSKNTVNTHLPICFVCLLKFFSLGKNCIIKGLHPLALLFYPPSAVFLLKWPFLGWQKIFSTLIVNNQTVDICWSPWYVPKIPFQMIIQVQKYLLPGNAFLYLFSLWIISHWPCRWISFSHNNEVKYNLCARVKIICFSSAFSPLRQ